MANELGQQIIRSRKSSNGAKCGGAPTRRALEGVVVDGGEAWAWKSHDDATGCQILFDQGSTMTMVIFTPDMDDDYREIVATAVVVRRRRHPPRHESFPASRGETP